MIKVGITGGIGSGKSTVCRLFAERGVPIYDSDAAAKRLMQDDPPLRAAITAEFGEEAYLDGVLNRTYLADIVFHDLARRAVLNGLVHPAVRADFEKWAQAQNHPYVVVESAILFEAGFDSCVDQTIAVLAPLALRVARTCSRDHVSEASVRDRIAAQMDDDQLHQRAKLTIVNIFEEDLAPTVATLDKHFCHEAISR
ncbi:MAG: dephospho-CoA kinase [Alistipes sp.]